MEMETMFGGFADRAEGGHELAKALAPYRGKADTIVIALPRGGVVTGAAVAEDLDLPLDVLVVRKLGAPGRKELAMGALGPGGVRVLNDDVVSVLRVTPDRIDAACRAEAFELARREHLYRDSEPPLDFRRKTVIVVDDGLATGSTMAAALAVIRKHDPARVIVAVPVAPIETLQRLRSVADDLVYLETPEPFLAVGYWYVDFAQVSDAEVVATLDRVRSRIAVAV